MTFIKDSHRPLSDVIHGFPEEDLRVETRYNPGYFPAWIGIQLVEPGRYVILRKLGYGQHSSVWLARDRELQRFVAIKIMTCEATRALESGRSDEVGMLKKIATTDRSHDGSRRVMEYYDSFDLEGPHGMHRCIVTEVLGISLDYLRQETPGDSRLSARVVKAIVRQVLLGLDYLHNSCGIVHADLKFDNIMFRPDDVTACVTNDLVNDPARTYPVFPTKRPPAIPVESQVVSIWSSPLAPEEIRLDVVIADFGHSHWVDRHFQELIQPMALRAPEVILGYGWNGAADIWSVGCLTAELLTGIWLFKPSRESAWDASEDHLARMTETLEEPFPFDMLEKCEHREIYFKGDGTFAHFTSHAEPNWTLRKLLLELSKNNYDEQEIDGAVKFLKRCMRLKPEDRASPRELADDPWLVQV